MRVDDIRLSSPAFLDTLLADALFKKVAWFKLWTKAVNKQKM
jgi:hypothetical protein